ncbi:unnamed protein product [Parnassius apollo]|uniref:(apollo) hypothetical protein n=1 Tax=Parnassius apollo TaxID=110799 RepID=A0A8S3XHF7_PARAO|nr:unnamed protein product [Parnassius apollo]
MNRHRGTSSRCRKILKLVNYGIHGSADIVSSKHFLIHVKYFFSDNIINEDDSSIELEEQNEIKENFTYLSRSSFPIDGISDLKEVNSEPDDFITSAPLIVVNVSPNDNNTSPPNLPTNDILDISHNVIESLLPEMEYPTPL